MNSTLSRKGEKQERNKGGNIFAHVVTEEVTGFNYKYSRYLRVNHHIRILIPGSVAEVQGEGATVQQKKLQSDCVCQSATYLLSLLHIPFTVSNFKFG